MSVLEEQIARTLLPGMHLPDPLKRLFEWIEVNGYYTDTAEGKRVGYLSSQEKLREGSTDTERPGGTIIEFFAEGNENLPYWFGHDHPDVMNRLCVFAKTGADGSMAALWLAPDGSQKIVHLGSGSGSTMVCVLADDAVDFLRLLAIGYDEICWGNDYTDTPNAHLVQGTPLVHPNDPYRQWVERTFDVQIPKTGSEIVQHPASMEDADSPDPFNRWVAENSA